MGADHQGRRHQGRMMLSPLRNDAPNVPRTHAGVLSISEPKVRQQCPSTTSAYSTSNICPRDLCRHPEGAARRAARPARERKPGRSLGADPGRGACLPDRRGARRTGAALSRRRGSAAARAEPADRLQQRRRLRSRRCRGLHGGRRARGQSVRRQRPFGGRACARHAADAVEAHHRGRSRAAARSECQPQRPDGHRGARQDHRHRRARQCRPPHRRTLQGPAST